MTHIWNWRDPPKHHAKPNERSIGMRSFRKHSLRKFGRIIFFALGVLGLPLSPLWAQEVHLIVQPDQGSIGTQRTLSADTTGFSRPVYRFTGRLVWPTTQDFVIREWQTQSSVTWVPQTAGLYNLTVFVREVRGPGKIRTRRSTVRSTVWFPVQLTLHPAPPSPAPSAGNITLVAVESGIPSGATNQFQFQIVSQNSTTSRGPFPTDSTTYRHVENLACGTYNFDAQVRSYRDGLLVGQADAQNVYYKVCP